MNEADSSPGNGAPVTPPAPAEPQAQAAPGIDMSQLVAQLAPAIASTIDEKLAAQENRIFANLRKSGALKQDRPAGEPAATSQPSQSAPSVAQAGMTQADMDARLDARLELERVIATREGKHGLNEAQSKRLRSALGGVSRESLAAEADSYLADMGLVKAQTPPAQATQAQAPATAPAKPNVSDRGAAAPTDNRDHNGVLNSRPLEMTGHDFEALMLQHGEDKGLAEFQAHALRALGKIKIKPPRG